LSLPKPGRRSFADMAQIGSEVADHRRSLVRLSSSSDLAASNSDCFGESFPFHD